MQKDNERTQFLELYDLRVLRIPNNEVNQNFDGVCQQIALMVEESK